MGDLTGTFGVAVQTAAGWIFKPSCVPVAGKPALVARAGEAWGIAGMGEATGGYYVSIRTGGAPALLPLGCPDDDDEEENPGCTGADALCSICPCVSVLASTYLVTISGFPDVCTTATLNGAWALSWRSDCVWQCDIDDAHSVRLSAQEGPFWRITWAAGTTGGISGYFGGQGGSDCAPESQEFVYWYVSNTTGCDGLLNALWTQVSMVVSKGG